MAGLAILRAPASAQSRLLEHVTVIDGTGGAPMPDAFVLVENERIARVSCTPLSADGAMTINGRGKYVIPSLTDMHIHLAGGAGLCDLDSSRRLPDPDRT